MSIFCYSFTSAQRACYFYYFCYHFLSPFFFVYYYIVFGLKYFRTLPKTATCTVTVVQRATGVSLNKTSLGLIIGGTETLTAAVTPDNTTDKSVTWSSSNTAVAAVSNGKITAVAEGTAIITVKSTDGGFTAACAVTVYSGISSSVFEIDNDEKVIILPPRTSITALRAGLTPSDSITVTDRNNTPYTSGNVGTGAKVKLTGTNIEFIVIVYGDVTGRGAVDEKDFETLLEYIRQDKIIDVDGVVNPFKDDIEFFEKIAKGDRQGSRIDIEDLMFIRQNME
jgi:hypothetical protein